MTCRVRKTPAGGVPTALRLLALSLLLQTPLLAMVNEVDPSPADVPWPDLSEMDVPIRRQIEAAREIIEELGGGSTVDGTDLAEAYGRAGQLLLVYSLADAARTCLENATRLAPRDHRWVYYLGLLHQRDGDPTTAAGYFRRALALEPRDLPSLIRLARAEADIRDFAAATTHFEQALVADPDNAAALFGLGQLAAARSDLETAVARFETVLELQPDATVVHYPLALAYRDLGQPERARAHLAQQGPAPVRFDDPLERQLGVHVQSANLLVLSATRARAAGDLEAAVRGFRQALEIDPAANSTRLSLASTLIQQGELATARGVLEEVLRYAPNSSTAHYNLGLVLLELGDRQAALEPLGRAADLAPDFLDAQLNHGLLLQEFGQLETAAARYTRAVELDPTDPEIRIRLAAILLQLGQTEAALEHLEQALIRQPDAVDGHLLLARALATDARYSAAADSFGAVLALEPNHQEALFGRALALLLAEEYVLAREHLEPAVQRDPGDLVLAHLLARLLVTCPDAVVRDGVRGLRMAEEIAIAQPALDHAETVAMALAELGRFAEAQSIQRQIIAEATRRNSDRATLDRLRRNLSSYDDHLPVRAPWMHFD